MGSTDPVEGILEKMIFTHSKYLLDRSFRFWILFN